MKLCTLFLLLAASANAYLMSPMAAKAPLLSRVAQRPNVARFTMAEEAAAADAVAPEGSEQHPTEPPHVRSWSQRWLLSGTTHRAPHTPRYRHPFPSPLPFPPTTRTGQSLATDALPPHLPPFCGAAVCIEDEAVEECVLAEWPAGKLAVPQSLVDRVSLGFLFFAWFALNVM